MKLPILLLAGVAATSSAAPFSVFHEESYECSDGTPIASIELTGLEHTNNHVVLRELLHKVGDSFSQETFETEKLKLQDLDLFTDITVTCEPANESINDIIGDAAEPETAPVTYRSASVESPRSSNTDVLSSVLSSLSSNTDSLSAFVTRVSSGTDSLSSLIESFSSNADSLMSLVSRLSFNTSSLSALVSRILSNTDSLAALASPKKAEEPVIQQQTSNTGYLSSAHSLNASKLVYHFKEIFRWIPSPATKTSDRDGFMIGLALANLNVLGEDIRAEVQYRTAVNPFFEKNEYALYVSSPYFLGLPVGWNFEFSRTNSWDDVREFRDANWLVNLDLSWRLLSHFSILGHTAYRYLEGGPGHLPEFGLGFAIDFRDSERDTRKGIYFESSVMHMGFREMNDEHYTEFLEDGRAYYSFGPFVTGASALVRLRPGTVKHYDYFYHGGENSFRGHYASSRYVGIHEALVTLEERFVLLERRPASLCGVNFFYGLQLVAGMDGSLLWDEGAPKWKNYEGAVYGGIHLIVPALDRIRFEVGYSPDYGEPKFYFGFFDKPSTSRWRSR